MTKWHYVEFHACACIPGRRRFTNANDACDFRDLMLSERHKCENSVWAHTETEFILEEGCLYDFRYQSRFTPEFTEKLLKLTSYFPEDRRPDKPWWRRRYPQPNRKRQPKSIARMQSFLDRVATRAGSIDTRYGVMERYRIFRSRPLNSQWPPLHPWYMLVFLPLCWLNDRIVNKACRRD